jgi:hypothetical protein
MVLAMIKLFKWIIRIVFGVSVCFAYGETLPPAQPLPISKEIIQQKFQDATLLKSKYTLNDVTFFKTDIKNAELDKYKGEPKDEIKVEIGDNTPIVEKGLIGGSSEKEFSPKIKLTRWNEVSFKLKPKGLDSVATKDKSLDFVGDKVEFKSPKMNVEMFEVPTTTTDEGSYKYIWYLNEKPATNKVEFDIETSGLDFFYQPPLTEEFKNGYSEEFQKEIVVSETQVKDLDGNVLVYRPENVVGGYAVYHSAKGGMNDVNGKDYKTGQAFFIYRPHIFDAEDKETWGELRINAEAGTYTVTIPQEFLDKAVYPVRSNDTIGYTTKGGTGTATVASYVVAFGPHAGVNGSATSVTVYFKSGSGSSGKMTLGVYSHSSGSTPGTLLKDGGDETIAGSFDDWETSNLDSSLSISSGSSYWPAYNKSVNGTGYYNSGTGYYARYASQTYSGGSLLASPSWSGSGGIYDNKLWSAYITYTPSGEGITTTTPAVIFFE